MYTRSRNSWVEKVHLRILGFFVGFVMTYIVYWAADSAYRLSPEHINIVIITSKLLILDLAASTVALQKMKNTFNYYLMFTKFRLFESSYEDQVSQSQLSFYLCWWGKSQIIRFATEVCSQIM